MRRSIIRSCGQPVEIPHRRTTAPCIGPRYHDEGHDAVHVCDIDMLSASDHAVWDEALRRAAVIVTKDEDFIVIGQSKPDTPAPAVV
ncbi:DUF5615 family PIN-like protein [Nocardia brasiliensis]|uniref:DUF5615 family PIN-like protein n=1 Tax=Nocardia brasiliensis TaxID=37326 RepID=UPI003D940755